VTDYLIIDTELRNYIVAEIFGPVDEGFRDTDRIVDLLMLISCDLDTDGSALFTKDDVDQVEGFLKRGEYPSFLWYCPAVVFVLYVLRGALKDLHLPLTKAKNWKSLAKRFTKIMNEV